MDDSELEALVCEKKRVMAGLWAAIGVDTLEFVQELVATRDAKGLLAAATTAGICSTKLELLGQPKNVTGGHSGAANPLIVTPPDKGA